MLQSDSGGNTIKENAREVLLNSGDTRMVLAALVTVTRAGRSLAENHELPDAYNVFCQTLLTHARELYPQTAQSCDTTHFAQVDQPVTAAPYEEKLARANLLTRIVPLYPQTARSEGLQGTVIFSALINKSGEVEELGLKRGAFIFYPSSLEALKKWRFKPAVVNGSASGYFNDHYYQLFPKPVTQAPSLRSHLDPLAAVRRAWTEPRP